MLGNSNLFPWDLSEMFYTIMIAFTLLLRIAVCLSQLSPDFFHLCTEIHNVSIASLPTSHTDTINKESGGGRIFLVKVGSIRIASMSYVY